MTTPNFETVTEFEKRIAAFFGAPYAVCVDSCTHSIELCLRYTKAPVVCCPTHTYLSIPMLHKKLGIRLFWLDAEWEDFYYVSHNIIDAAVYWKQGGYMPNTFMCVSFQYQKHLSLGRGGCILTDKKEAAIQLRKMAYDGRIPGTPWRDQNIDTIGYHYYMTPDTAQDGLNKLDKAIATEPRKWVYTDWPDISQMDVFKNKL